MAAAFLLFFKDWWRLSSHVFLSLDSSVLYYPVYSWVHQHLAQDKLPLICDDVMHGAPIAAYSMAGVLSPALWLFHEVSSYVLAYNLLFLFPQAFYLVGAYFLGRKLKLSQSASLLLAFLWAFNGHQMAQLDHQNVAWAHAFFPWAFLALLRYLEVKQPLFILLSGILLGLDLLSGHPQVFFLECLFFLFWAFLYDGFSWKERAKASGLMVLGAVLTASPLILFTTECLWGDFQGQWGVVDRFYHSWTPLNLITLIYPWFFGKTQFDRAGTDYWWQYQFVEMQVAFSIAGLFLFLLFFVGKDPRKKWIGLTFLFALVMSMGKFFLFYSPIQSLPFFSFFRDPARYWFLGTWVWGLGAGMAWDRWLAEKRLEAPARKLALGLFGLVVGIPLIGGLLVSAGRPLLLGAASFFIRHFLLGDATHPQSLDFYLGHVPQKLEYLASSLSLIRPRVFLPLFFSTSLAVAVWSRNRWNPVHLKFFLLLLVLADLYAFRMPLGNAFYKPADITAPQVPAPRNRSLSLCYLSPSPLPQQYGEMAYPNMNILFNRPNLVFDANPTPRRYADIWAELGWFSWVYKDRDPMGFTHHVDDLKRLGIDQIVSDIPLKLSSPFKTIQDRYPYTYSIQGALPRAFLVPIEDKAEKTPIQPLSVIQHWDETSLLILTWPNVSSNLILQKTLIPGWKCHVFCISPPPGSENETLTFLPKSWVTLDKDVPLIPYGEVLTSISLPKGENDVSLTYEPNSLRLGFFLFFLITGLFGLQFLRRLMA